jgi:hypothetical protein
MGATSVVNPPNNRPENVQSPHNAGTCAVGAFLWRWCPLSIYTLSDLIFVGKAWIDRWRPLIPFFLASRARDPHLGLLGLAGRCYTCVTPTTHPDYAN